MTAKTILLAQYDLHHVLFNNVIAGISDEEANRSISNMNSIKWLAGHNLWDLGTFALICNVEIDFPWFGYFHSVEGATELDYGTPKNPTPSIEMIRENWNETVPLIRIELEKLSDSQLNEVINIPHPLASFNNTRAGWWAYTNHHQAYNIGQMSVLRKALGKPAMSYRKNTF